jgi:hypothetical protein
LRVPEDDSDGNRWTPSSGRGQRTGKREPGRPATRPRNTPDSGIDGLGESGPGGFVFDNVDGDEDEYPGVDESERVKATLARIAGPSPETVVQRAAAAVDDLDAAVAFVEDGGLADLQQAIESTAEPDVRRRGERALSAFRQFRAAARGESPTEHFRRGRDTDIRGGTEAPRE